ncbi:MAG TPA: cbb3-type cytochrome c oxidase subunit I [Acidimicrobiales bacterium]|nr:cbb3-type cytochrome c oxidase subunit I [Acidimicrobiales bacterium]
MNLLNTADHKRIGQLQIIAAVVALAIGGAAAVAIRVMANSGTIDHFGALSSLDHALGGVFVVLPLWLGIATVIVPLQIGTNRLAFPRLAALALWSHIGGMAAVVWGYTSTPAPSGGRTVLSVVPLPASLAKAANTKGADLVVLGMLLGSVAIVLMAVNLVATIISRRAHGLTLGRLPYFAWSVLVGGIGVALATPVFIGGLSLVWVDQHFGGSFFTTGAANVFWTHAVWLGGRPEALLGATFVLGAGSDIIATATGRRNELDQVTRAGLAAFATLAFAPWTLTPDQAGGVLAPFSNVVTILPILAAGVVILTWLGQLRHGLKMIPAMAPLVSALLLGLVGLGVALLRLATDARGTIWSEHSVLLVAVAIPVAGAVAALVHWAPKIVGGPVATPAASLAGLATAAGFGLFTASGVLLGADGAEAFGPTWSTEGGRGALAILGAVGIGLASLGVVVMALAYAGARNKAGAANTYGTGVTLEWAAASPPPPHNFDSVPDVTSPTPLLQGVSS